MGNDQTAEEAAQQAALKKVFFKSIFYEISHKLGESDLFKNAMTIAEGAAISAAQQMGVDPDVMLYRMSIEFQKKAAAKCAELEGKGNE